MSVILFNEPSGRRNASYTRLTRCATHFGFTVPASASDVRQGYALRSSLSIQFGLRPLFGLGIALPHIGRRSRNVESKMICAKLLPRAGTSGAFFFLWSEHLVVHADHHRNEHYRVIEELYFDSKLRQQHLQETDGHRRPWLQTRISVIESGSALTQLASRKKLYHA